MTPDLADQDLHELRPAPGVLLRHRGAEVDVHEVPRSGPRVELRHGALWIRVVDDGPGVTVVHGASSIQLRSGAAVVEVHDVEALLLVAAGQAAVKGSAPLPRSVVAGQAVALTVDGTTSEPDRFAAEELASDRMVVENLARDLLAARPPAPLPDLPDASEIVDRTPRRRPPELLLRSAEVGSEPSHLETALANVGVTDRPGPPEIGAAGSATVERAPGDETGRDEIVGGAGVASAVAPANDDVDPVPAEPALDDAGPSPAERDESRRRKVIGLIVVAMIVLAIFAAVVLTASG